MEKHYDPAAIERKWAQWWGEQGVFRADPGASGDPYCVVIPPPNVTGMLHMGHALNNVVQDILVRWRRMQGRNTVWVPGTDHAGIATQNVVERALRAEGGSREALGREAFLEKVWQWRDQYGRTITRQLRRIGASCDWSRERFTMDEGLSAAVTEVFCRLYEQGRIYRGNYIVNWCPRCHTALSDEESEHRARAGKLYYIRYPRRDGGTLTVATTRPETLLGDVAVAVHPDDPRYDGLEDGVVVLPILDRPLRVVRDAHVDPAFGTGVVKVTPAHDPNDFEIAQRHGLEPLNVMHGDGTMNAAAGPYAGMDRFACREKILSDLEAAGLLERVEPHDHAVGHCYRCDTVVEPRLSPQWFVRMRPLAEPAIEAVRSGRIVFVPDRWTKVYLDWMENIRDWCISRQIWWGHRIPVYTCGTCGDVRAARSAPQHCPACGGAGNIRQDEDVLDTWFSSWLWPFSVFGWPDDTPDLRCYYPTHDLVTASEIIFFWVARMIMAGLAFRGDVPFQRVYIHGTVRDAQGRKMSKSLGNSIDPLRIVDRYGADALRFSLMMLTATGQDVFLTDEKFEIGRNFGTKLWNAARFVLQHRPPDRPSVTGIDDPAFVPDPAGLSVEDRYILGSAAEAVRHATAHLEAVRLQELAQTLHEFIWHRFCDWYLESVKPDLNGTDAGRRAQVLAILDAVLATALRLLHPLMPFVTEELWQALRAGKAQTLTRTPWPVPPAEAGLADWGVDETSMRFAADRHDLIRVGRQLRADYNIPPARPVRFVVAAEPPETLERLRSETGALAVLLRAASVDFITAPAAGEPMPCGVSRLGTIYMPLQGLVDPDAEIARLETQRNKTAAGIAQGLAKLDNPRFTQNAPAEVVAAARTRCEQLQETLPWIDRQIEMFRAVKA